MAPDRNFRLEVCLALGFTCLIAMSCTSGARPPSGTQWKRCVRLHLSVDQENGVESSGGVLLRLSLTNVCDRTVTLPEELVKQRIGIGAFIQHYSERDGVLIEDPVPLEACWPFMTLSVGTSLGRRQPAISLRSGETQWVAWCTRVLEEKGRYRMWATLFIPPDGFTAESGEKDTGVTLRSNVVEILRE